MLNRIYDGTAEKAYGQVLYLERHMKSRGEQRRKGIGIFAENPFQEQGIVIYYISLFDLQILCI